MPRPPTVLVIDPDRAIHRYLRRHLVAEGYAVSSTEIGKALSVAGEIQADIILFDMSLDGCGTLTLSAIRAVCQAPVLGFVPRGGYAELASAFDAGAEDCVAKPFTIEEVLTRVRKLLGHAMIRKGKRPVLLSGALRFDRVLGRVYKSGEILPLRERQFRLLEALVDGDGWVLEHHELINAMCTGKPATISKLRQAIQYLRRKIEPDPENPLHILTVPGVGYRFVLHGKQRDLGLP